MYKIYSIHNIHSMGNTHTTLSAKNFDPSRMPVAVSADGKTLLAENAVIFNVGVREIGAFPANAVVALTLSVPGYRDQVCHTATAGLVTQSMLQKGFTFALDKACIETSSLHVRVMSGAQCVAERAIPVKSLKYSGQKFFNETISFGMLQGPDRNSKSVPTVKLAFELLAVGDGKVHVAKQPHYMDLELASAPGVGIHPLGLVR